MVLTFKIICGEKKRPGGKLVKVCLKFSNNEILGALITGDFFTNADLLDGLNNEIQKLKCNKDEIIKVISSKIRKKNIKFAGIEINDLKDAVKRAILKLD